MFAKVEVEEVPVVEVNITKTKKTVNRKKKVSTKKLKEMNPFKIGDKIYVVQLTNTMKCAQTPKLRDFYKTHFWLIEGYGEVVDIENDYCITIKPDTYTDLVNVHVGDVIKAYIKMDPRRTRF